MNPPETIKTARRVLIEIALLASALPAGAADPSSSHAAPDQVLLLDDLGRLVQVPTNRMPARLRPRSGVSLERQTPTPIPGVSTPPEVLERREQARQGDEEFHFFPPVAPRLMPYLSSQDEYGNTALRPGALVPVVPFEPVVQGGKSWLSERGLRYALEQTFNFVAMSEVMQGNNTLGFYTLDLKAKWALFDAPRAGTAGWITTQIEAKSGLGAAGQTQDAKSNLGTLTDPTDIWSSINGLRVPELGWQQSLRDGEVVVVAGMLSQRNYLDGNAAAHTGRGEFMNSALIHSEVLPLSQYNFGLNLQWQPAKQWYAMLGTSVGDAPAGSAPWVDFSWEHWSLIGEFGYAPDDFLGIGPGVYRVQPFVAQAGGATEGGLCFNLQQRLGHDSPFAWFGRFGFAGSDVGATASAQAGTGFVMQAPLKHAGLVPPLSNDLLGVGFVWSQPTATTRTVYHENEYVFETFYTLQLTPTMKLQPDMQVVWEPVFNPDPGPAVVAQLQLVLAW